MRRPDPQFECNIPEYMEIIKNYLNCTEEEISTDYDLFKDSEQYDLEEMWDIPKELDIVLEMKDLSASLFSYGHVILGIYKGVKVVVEQNASPILVYWKSNGS